MFMVYGIVYNAWKRCQYKVFELSTHVMKKEYINITRSTQFKAHFSDWSAEMLPKENVKKINYFSGKRNDPGNIQ